MHLDILLSRPLPYLQHCRISEITEVKAENWAICCASFHLSVRSFGSQSWITRKYICTPYTHSTLRIRMLGTLRLVTVTYHQTRVPLTSMSKMTAESSFWSTMTALKPNIYNYCSKVLVRMWYMPSSERIMRAGMRARCMKSVEMTVHSRDAIQLELFTCFARIELHREARIWFRSW